MESLESVVAAAQEEAGAEAGDGPDTATVAGDVGSGEDSTGGRNLSRPCSQEKAKGRAEVRVQCLHP